VVWSKAVVDGLSNFFPKYLSPPSAGLIIWKPWGKRSHLEAHSGTWDCRLHHRSTSSS
jgi:hypothetical protein